MIPGPPLPPPDSTMMISHMRACFANGQWIASANFSVVLIVDDDDDTGSRRARNADLSGPPRAEPEPLLPALRPRVDRQPEPW